MSKGRCSGCKEVAAQRFKRKGGLFCKACLNKKETKSKVRSILDRLLH